MGPALRPPGAFPPSSEEGLSKQSYVMSSVIGVVLLTRKKFMLLRNSSCPGAPGGCQNRFAPSPLLLPSGLGGHGGASTCSGHCLLAASWAVSRLLRAPPPLSAPVTPAGGVAGASSVLGMTLRGGAPWGPAG